MAQALPVKVELDWKDVSIGEPVGLDLSSDSEFAPDESLLSAVNVVSRGNYLETDYGMVKFHNSVIGVPRKVATIILTSGVIESFLITNQTVYRQVGNSWKPIGTTATTLTETLTAGALDGNVASIAGFSSGNIIGILLDDGTWQVNIIIGAPAGGNIVWFYPLTAGATTGNSIVKSEYVLTGDNDHSVHWVAVPFSNEIIFTNGVDNVKRINTTTFVIDNVPDLPTNTKCTSLAMWDNSVFLIRTIENGVSFPRRYRYSAAGNTADWTTVDDAGYSDLHDSSDELLFARSLGPYLIIYRTESIARLSPTGDATRRFDNPTVVHGSGLLSTDGCVEIADNTHFCVGRNNIYLYEGGFTVKEIGDPIARAFLSDTGRLEYLYANRLFCLFDKADRKAMIFYTDANSLANFPNRAWIYSVDNGKWTERTVLDNLTGWGEILGTSADYSWSSLIGSWLDQDWKWGGVNVSTLRRVTLLCSLDLVTKEYSSLIAGDGATPLPVVVETKDFSTPDMKSLLDRLSLIAAGSDVQILYSKDRGQTYTSMGTHTYGATPAHKRYWKQLTFDTIRFKIIANGYFKLARFAFKMKVSAEF